MDSDLKQALEQALSTAKELRALGVSRLRVTSGDAAIELEMAPAEPELPSWEEIEAAGRGEPTTTHLEPSDVLEMNDQTMDSAFDRLVSDSYGRPTGQPSEPS